MVIRPLRYFCLIKFYNAAILVSTLSYKCKTTATRTSQQRPRGLKRHKQTILLFLVLGVVQIISRIKDNEVQVNNINDKFILRT